MKTENWNNHEIRFVEHNGEWWAVAKDVASALGYLNSNEAVNYHVDEDDKLMYNSKTQSQFAIELDYKELGQRGGWLISEFGIYDLIFGSAKAEAKVFKKWVKQVIKSLRQISGLEAYQVFRMLDKAHQNESMGFINRNLKEPTKRDFIKANTIANKAVSNKYGFSKMVKKDEMSPEMLVDRQPILEDTVNLIVTKDRFNLNISVSQEVYQMVESEKQTFPA